MDKRTLSGCIAALVGLMLFTLIGYVLGAKLQHVQTTPWGQLPLLDLTGIFVSMVAGGALAGRRFTWFAVGLVALMWLAIVFVLVSVQPEMTLAKVLLQPAGDRIEPAARVARRLRGRAPEGTAQRPARDRVIERLSRRA